MNKSFVIEKKNHMIHVNSNGIDFNELALGVQSYLASVSEQRNLDIQEVISKFFGIIDEVGALKKVELI